MGWNFPIQLDLRAHAHHSTSHICTGTVSEVSTEKMTKESAGKTITRNGTEDNPAVFVEREDSNKNPVVKKVGDQESHLLLLGSALLGFE